MRKVFTSVVVALSIVLPAVGASPPVAASPANEYSGTHFGAGKLPAGCENDALVGQLTLRSLSSYQDPRSLNNACYHMRTGLNSLDSPQVDVLVMVPVSPTAERDMRVMRQSVEMWEGGIDYLAGEMGLSWLADGMDFHITVDYFDPAGDNGGEFTTTPIVDPEIVVIASNPVGGIGIGIDPWPAGVPCHPVSNPFDFDAWKNVPGFNSHHGQRTGTYSEDCKPGGGGNVCFAVNGAIEPAGLDIFGLFDLVSHEFGHCLTVGHVGDGAEGKWGKVPTNDIMAYSSDPPGLNKCVSTLDVEGVALRMSRYLDVNRDGTITPADHLSANDSVGQGGNPFQVQRPSDHLYASSTGDVEQCPQPDLGFVPSGQRTDWTPTPVATTAPAPTASAPQPSGTAPSGTTSQPSQPSPSGSSPTTTSPQPAPSGTSPSSGSGEPAPSSTSPTTSSPNTSSDAPAQGNSTQSPGGVADLTRIAGADRIETAISASQLAFGPHAAGAVVLARADQFADGLAGTSLAAHLDAPTLLTPGSGLDPRATEEIQRVLPQGRQVFVLGGPAALSSATDAQLESMGYSVVRLAGADRFETSVRVAMAQPQPESILLATGRNFPDALAAGAAAAKAAGVVLLTNDGSLPPSVADYLDRYGNVPRVAIGGPAARALPSAESITGIDRFATSVAVARRFFTSPGVAGLTTGVAFADALSGGSLLARSGGPLLLTPPTALSATASEYLSRNGSSINNLFVVGGESAVAQPVAEEALQALQG